MTTKTTADLTTISVAATKRKLRLLSIDLDDFSHTEQNTIYYCSVERTIIKHCVFRQEIQPLTLLVEEGSENGERSQNFIAGFTHGYGSFG